MERHRCCFAYALLCVERRKPNDTFCCHLAKVTIVEYSQFDNEHNLIPSKPQCPGIGVTPRDRTRSAHRANRSHRDSIRRGYADELEPSLVSSRMRCRCVTTYGVRKHCLQGFCDDLCSCWPSGDKERLGSGGISCKCSGHAQSQSSCIRFEMPDCRTAHLSAKLGAEQAIEGGTWFGFGSDAACGL